MFKQGNEERDRLIYECVEYLKEHVTGWNWQGVSFELSFRSNGKYDETPDTCRKAYKRYCDKMSNVSCDDDGGYFEKINLTDEEKEYVSAKLDKPKGKQIVSVEIKQDGTQISERRILMSETDSKSPEFCLIAHGFDPKLWEVVSIKNNFWDSAFGEGEINTLYQSKLICKPKVREELTKEDILELQKEFSYKHQPIYKIVDNGNGHHALFVEIGDLHLGLFSWGEETGENADYVIIETKFREVIAKIKKFILSHPEIDSVYLIFGGDIIHVDNEQNTTSGGTVMQFDGRAKKMVSIAYKVLSWAILEFSFVKHLFVKVVEGNHGRLTEFTIFEGLKNMFSEFENIDFDNSPMARKAVLYGQDLIGLSHGELSNKKNQSWLQIEFAELWGKSKRREIHLFHLHKEEIEPTEFGITIRRNPTIKPTDHYEYFNAFIGADKKIACYLYDEKEGLESINYFRSMFTR